MKVRLTTLNKGEHFKLNGVEYEKMEKRERGNNCLNLSTKQVETHPLMLYVEKVEPKKARKLPAPWTPDPKAVEKAKQEFENGDTITTEEYLAELDEQLKNKATIRLKRKQTE